MRPPSPHSSSRPGERAQRTARGCAEMDGCWGAGTHGVCQPALGCRVHLLSADYEWWPSEAAAPPTIPLQQAAS